MNVHDEMSDTEVLRAASDSLSGIPVASRPDVAAIMARGRSRRRRHRVTAVAGLSAAAAGTALVLGLTGVLGPGPARSPGTIRTAAFTLVSNPNGTVALTIRLRELLHPATLQNDLAQFGIRAMVTSGSFCSSDPAPVGFSQAVSVYPAVLHRGSLVHPTIITFDPAAMPAGTELSFGYFQLSSDLQQADVVLIDTNSYTCTSTPPTFGPDAGPDGGVALQSGPGPGGS
jgi:hypothetical protein